MKKGQIAFDLGLFYKGLRMGSGQTPVKAYNRNLCQLIATGKAKPSFLVLTNCRCTKHPMRTGISTPARTGGPKSC